MKEKRLNQIMDIVQSQKRVSVEELVSLFNVSNMTIRRDLKELENKGTLIRYHGGAYLTENLSQEYTPLSVQEFSQKDEVAAQGCEYLKGILKGNCVNSVTFTSGSTMLAMVKKIDFHIPVSIITDNLKEAEILGKNPEHTVIMLGGVLNFSRQNTIGYLAEQMLDNVSIDYIFMGTSAIDNAGFVYCYSNFEASVLKKILLASKHTVVLADSSKIGKSNLVRVYEMNEKFTLITNETTPDIYLNTFRDMGVEVITTGRIPDII